MREIGIGIIGAGYMGKAHAVAMSAVGAVFGTTLRPRLVMLATRSEEGARASAARLGFRRSTGDWRVLVADPAVEAIIIASTQDTHREIALAAFAAGKPVFCEKPLGASLADGAAMVAAAEASGLANMTGFNYIRTPASRLARQLIADGTIGDVTYFRGEHSEDFLADPAIPATWRTVGPATGTIGDLAPHMINAAHALVGPIRSLVADMQIVHATRPSANGPAAVTNDDQAQFMCRLENGAMGMLFFSRIATGRKMGYAYEVHGTKGAIRFDQEDQNSLWLYRMEGPEALRGFTRILTGPEHPDYVNFCLGPGHGTGYQDQIIIEAKDFLEAIETGNPVWPTFAEGHYVNRVTEAMRRSIASSAWIDLSAV